MYGSRHSYTSVRLQTPEHGAPVSIWQVASELGHQSTAMIEKRYGQLASVTERKAVVEFLPARNVDAQLGKVDSALPKIHQSVAAECTEVSHNSIPASQIPYSSSNAVTNLVSNLTLATDQ